MNSDISDTVFVTIGHPNSNIPIMNKVAVFVCNDVTVCKTAKKLRKQVANNVGNHGYVKGTTFKPAELYWEVYAFSDSSVPLMASLNSPSKMKR